MKHKVVNFTHFIDCITSVKLWLHQKCLCLNERKTECIFLGDDAPCNLSTLTFKFRPKVKNWGVILYKYLKFDKHKASVGMASFYQLHILTKVKPFSNCPDLEKAIHVFYWLKA